MTETGDWRVAALRRRLLLTLLVAGQTLAGLWLFAGTLQTVPDTWAIYPLLAMFAVLFAWIGVGFWTAVYGFVVLRRGGDHLSLSRRFPDTGDQEPPSPSADRPPERQAAPTAVVMPIYHEPVQRTLNGLHAMIRDLARQGQAPAVDFYVLSDSRDPEVWLAEQAGCEQLRGQLGARQRLFYRRRTINQNHKSGNIADFLRRWGRQYRYMIVLDADSLLTGRCITRLIELMDNRPQAGIIQTAPRLARAETRFARLQQFANRCYGRLYGAGLAAIQLGQATYWGHNAIIRVAPFMRHCGLRKLKGPGLFSGPVLSHDFVESALMGRAGFEVWLEPAIAGSLEESPPTLDDDLIRDQRWCRGNLQHLWLLARLRRLPLAHRMALVTGILSYLASPLWLTFLGLSGYVALIGSTTGATLPGLFTAGENGAGHSVGLATMTALLLFGPRCLALTDLTLSGRLRPFGGPVRLGLSALQETLVSLALAPVRMVIHTIYVIRAGLNRTLRWQGQNRSGGYRFGHSLRRLSPAAVSAALAFGLIQWHAPALTPWASLVCLPVMLAPLLAIWLNRKARRQWLHVPESFSAPTVVTLAEIGMGASDRSGSSLSRVEQLVLSPRQVRAVAHLARPIRGRKGSNLARLVHRCAEDGQSALSHREMSLICSHPQALEALHQRAWRASPGSPWQLALNRLACSVTDADTCSPSDYQDNTQWIGAAS